jgi:hypothetical protein
MEGSALSSDGPALTADEDFERVRRRLDSFIDDLEKPKN